jgi:hypothetical protein
MNAPREATPVMQWEMYGPGSIIQFCGVRSEDGYGVRISRDDTAVFAADAASGASVMTYSTQLREHLQGRGFSPKPLAARSPQMAGGPCWGPAAPLDASLLSVR